MEPVSTHQADRSQTVVEWHRNGGAAVVESLIAHGVDTVFGIPGTHNLEIYRHLKLRGLRVVTVRHEQGAGYAADGYSQVTGRQGVVLTTSGPAVLNAVAAAGTAYAESRPVLFLASGLASGAEGLDSGELHDTKDAFGAMACVTKWSRRAESTEDISASLADAFWQLTDGRPRPAFVEIPHDYLAGSWRGEVAQPRERRQLPVAPDRIEAAADLLIGSQRPGIVVGGGARGVSSLVRELAERLNAPVLTTCNGKGVLPESHPLSLGANIRLESAHTWANTRDALLVIGSELSDSDLWGGTITNSHIIRVDVDPAQLRRNASPAIGLAARAEEAVPALIDAIGSRRGAARDSDAAALRGVFASEADELGLSWRALHAELRAALPSDVIITGDSSQSTYFGTVHYFPVDQPNSLLYMPRSATLGYALPAAIGAQVACPDRAVVAIVGDGAVMFSVQEFATAVEQGLGVVVLVANNGGYREIREQQLSLGIEPVGVDLVQPDFAALAVALGGYGEVATDAADVARRAAAAIGRDRPTLISFVC
ncbi:thiamine pyrophosphate-binding protein [Lysinibacter cavernae]|uniref:Acetolactate synthase-1/2/3 large subunit n=1 Tax=Lysinibacter cavernae TaxID=1640652 RepID=A0A7X5R2G0_9MICO|nr:acetolactate synthase-1/2/3 large subunit [Lysinibacter cavernae]